MNTQLLCLFTTKEELEHLKNAIIYNKGYKIPVENTQMHLYSSIVNEK
jgi:hypothetical protein